MNDGWLFKLRSNLGSRYVAPSWPSGEQREAIEPSSIEPEPSLTRGAPAAETKRAPDEDASD